VNGAVQRGHLGQFQPLSDSDHGRVRGAQRKIPVYDNQLGHPRVVAGGQLDSGESAIGQRLEEEGLNPGPGFTSQQEADLCHHGRWDQEFPAGGMHVGEQANTRQVISIV
jgi:hypothetical protein